MQRIRYLRHMRTIVHWLTELVLTLILVAIAVIVALALYTSLTG